MAYANNPLDFGRMEGGGNYLKGWLDEVAVADYAMTSDQVQHWATTSLSSAYSAPEPSAVVLLISGLIGLLCYAWRRQK